jgi:hypothetical protein
MRQFFLLVAAVFLLGIGTKAQDTAQTFSLFASPFDQPIAQPAAPGSSAPSLLPSSSLDFSLPEPVPSPPSSAASAPPDPPQGVYGVRPVFPFQAYIGYTFVRFYEVPGTTVNTNGFNYSIVYFPERLKNWVGADGEFVAGFGNQYPYQARFLLGMGGARFRWAPFSHTNLEIWAHGLAGASHYTPQTPYGKQGAFAYELGGGVDINAHRWRYAYRFGVDMVGTHYFGTNQFSPKISAGFVYRF